jgi:hypothetical protein
MVTRLAFVAKFGRFSTKNGDENSTRHQKWTFPGSKRRRDWPSSPKLHVSRLKIATRLRFVVKNGLFLDQNGDENDWTVSSPKFAVSHLKITIKKVGFH